MSIETLTTIIVEGLGSADRDVTEQTKSALEGIFGSRYQAKSQRSTRAALMTGEKVSFAGYVHQDSPSSGVYGGMSLIWFPIAGEDGGKGKSLLTFVCGTRGLSPDEHILGRPGHARHLQALRRHITQALNISAWVKHDPANLSQPLPQVVTEEYSQFKAVLDRYGNCLYAMAEVPHDQAKAERLVAAFLDFYAWERGWVALSSFTNEVETFKNALRGQLFPKVGTSALEALLQERKFVILQGPPGTGKTRQAGELLDGMFKGKGMTVQFHPAVAYETFVAGISPDVKERDLRFDIKPGWLLKASKESEQGPYLLVIDEINRADLGRVLGEAIYLLEAREIKAGRGREVVLPQPLPDGTNTLRIPDGLHILGTMNSADRSIAILDLAVRRRFAFVDVWPDLAVVEKQGLALATRAFSRLLDIFVQFAPSDSLVLMPGHAYFLADSEAELENRMLYELMPLLREYLQEGRLGMCESELMAYLDWLEGELTQHGQAP